MIHKKTVIISLVAVGVIAISAIWVSHAISSETQARIAAEKEFPMVKYEYKKEYKDYNFNSKEDISKAYLGNPIGEYALDECKYTPTKLIDQQITGPWAYLFPVMVNGEPRNELTISLTRKHQWEFLMYGGHMSSSEKSIVKKYNISNLKLLNAARCEFILGNDKNNNLKIIGQTVDGSYKEYSYDDFNKMIESYKNVLQKQKEEYKKTGRSIIGGPTMQLSKPPAQESIKNRLIKYIKSIF